MAVYECNGCGVACCEIHISTDEMDPEDVCSKARCPLNNDLFDFRLQDSIRYGCADDGTHRAICRHCRHNPNARDASKPNACDLSGTMKTWSDTCENWEDCKPTEEEIDQFHEDMEQEYLRETENTCGVCIWWHPEYIGSGGCTDGCSHPNRTGDEHTSHSDCDCDGWERSII